METETDRAGSETKPEPEFRAVVYGKTLKAWADQVGSINDVAKVEVSADGWNTTVVDPAHIAMGTIRIPTCAMVEWRVRESGTFILDIDRLKEFLKGVKDTKKDPTTIEIAGVSGLKLTMNYRNITRVFGVAPDADTFIPRVPNLSLPVKVGIGGEALWQAVKATTEFSDHLRIGSSGGNVSVAAQGETDQGATVFRSQYENREAVPAEAFYYAGIKESVDSLFSTDYLGRMVKTLRGYGVTVHLGTDYPLKLQWDVGSETNGLMLLAPRIEERDEAPKVPRVRDVDAMAVEPKVEPEAIPEVMATAVAIPDIIVALEPEAEIKELRETIAEGMAEARAAEGDEGPRPAFEVKAELPPTKAMAALAAEIRRDGLDYAWEESPSMVFLSVLASDRRVKDHASLLVAPVQDWPQRPFLEPSGMAKVLGWLNAVYGLAAVDPGALQALYDAVMR